MKIFYKGKLIEESEYIFLTEMSNLMPEHTGIDHPIWVGPNPESHGPIVKVYNSKHKITDENDNFSVSISDNPSIKSGIEMLDSRQLRKVFEFVKDNKETLLDYSNKKIDRKELLKRIKKV